MRQGFFFLAHMIQEGIDVVFQTIWPPIHNIEPGDWHSIHELQAQKQFWFFRVELFQNRPKNTHIMLNEELLVWRLRVREI
jgi:hypothetical protein